MTRPRSKAPTQAPNKHAPRAKSAPTQSARGTPAPKAAAPAKSAKQKTPPAKSAKRNGAPAKAIRKAVAPASSKAASSLKAQVKDAVAWLESQGSPRLRDEMGPRYGIHTDKAFGVSVGSLRQYAKGLGQSHELAAALWDARWYEARLLACFVDEPAEVTPAQMDRWCRDFDNWAICDTACFHLFDRTPHALGKVREWAKRREEFVKRGAFALLASMALHGRGADDAAFAQSLALVEGAAADPRNFVKKSVNWALRAIGRRTAELNAKAVAVAGRLASSADSTARWVGKDAQRELTSAATLRRFGLRSARR